jgi:class 3 adenylate cyclase
LTRTCPACGSVNEPGEDYCGVCGKALGDDQGRRPEHAAPERRQLTVMFCDLVGSTALARELDPEDLREVIHGYQKRAHELAARYDGFVARYMGDGILVYFGYPHAHEDAAARAIHAGLEIVDAVHGLEARPGVRLGVRIGVATGLVVVGDLVGEGAAAETLAMGETPNLAARLQALAAPGSVVVAARTRELAGGLFEYADDGAHALKGFPEPVRVWRVLRTSEIVSRFDAARGRGLTPLVGRDGELELLLERWQRARAGNGQVVLLSGEAGIGKSRIADALAERIARERHIRLRYQCSPYHGNSALYPFIQQLELAADLERRDSPERKLAKLEALLADSTPRDAETIALFAALLSLPPSDRYPALAMTAQEQKERTLVALFDRLRGLAAQAPVFMLLEDAHWIDPTSTEFLGQVARHAADIPVLALVTARSAAEHAWSGLPHVGAVQLERLDRAQSVAMIGQLPEGGRLPADLVEEIVARTDGVPLFIEELARTVAAPGPASGSTPAGRARSAAIPATLQDSLMERLDQLGPAKEVAQLGAVIGREFSRELVAAISPLNETELGDALGELRASGVVFGRGDSAHTFKHALVQDAAYASLLRSKRQELHARVAETLEASYPERVRVEPEVVAHHYTQAGRAMPAARYWAAAAQRAFDRSANLEALGHASRGLEVLAGVAEGRDRDRLELALEILRGAAYRAVKGFASSDAERSFADARALAARLDDVPRLIDARRGLFSCYYARGALALAGDEGRQVAALGERMNDRASRMLGRWMLGCVAFWQGEFPTAHRELEDAFALYDPREQRANTLALQIDPGVNALFHLGWALWILGYPDRAVRTSEQAVATARALSQPFALSMALFFACATRACCGERAAVRPLLDELQALVGAHGLGYMASVARVLEAQELIADGEYAAGLAQIGRAFAEFQAQEAGVGLPWAMSIAAAAYARLGKGEEGLGTVVKALAATDRNGERQWAAELWRLKGELLMLSPAHEAEAEACFARAAELARRQSARSLELRATLSLARLLDRQGKAERARALLAESCGWFADAAETDDLREARIALAGLSGGAAAGAPRAPGG